MHVNDLLARAVDLGASDLHLKSGGLPTARVRGELTPIPGAGRLQARDLDTIVAAILTPAQADRLSGQQDVDLAYSVPGLGRFRCNVFFQRGTVGMVFRVIPQRVSGFDALGLPPVLASIAAEERGLVLVTGTTGSGKSTTLAAIVDAINHARTAHVVTIEDPIEYLHQDDRSIINQRKSASIRSRSARRSAARCARTPM
jgi:twitching motility protein PilT